MTDSLASIFYSLVAIICIASLRFTWDVWAWFHPRPATPVSVPPTAKEGHTRETSYEPDPEAYTAKDAEADADAQVLRHWQRSLSPDEYRSPDEQDAYDIMVAGEKSELPLTVEYTRPEDYDLTGVPLTLGDEDDEE